MYTVEKSIYSLQSPWIIRNFRDQNQTFSFRALHWFKITHVLKWLPLLFLNQRKLPNFENYWNSWKIIDWEEGDAWWISMNSGEEFLLYVVSLSYHLSTFGWFNIMEMSWQISVSLLLRYSVLCYIIDVCIIIIDLIRNIRRFGNI